MVTRGGGNKFTGEKQESINEYSPNKKDGTNAQYDHYQQNDRIETYIYDCN